MVCLRTVEPVELVTQMVSETKPWSVILTR